jgi:hypothetical protein
VTSKQNIETALLFQPLIDLTLSFNSLLFPPFLKVRRDKLVRQLAGPHTTNLCIVCGGAGKHPGPAHQCIAQSEKRLCVKYDSRSQIEDVVKLWTGQRSGSLCAALSLTRL